MKKIRLLAATTMALLCTNPFSLNAAIDPSTAWWNNETFESFTAGTDLKTGWTNNGGSPFVMVQTLSAASTTGSASGNVLGFPIASATTFAESSAQTGGRGVYKVFENSLSGYVYVKTSFYTSTSGTTYSLKNSSGATVFEFGGISNNAGAALWCAGQSAATVAMGYRAKWADIEFILDLNNNKAVSVAITYSGTTKTFSNIALAAGGDVKRLDVSMIRSYCAAGFDNTTFGQLAPDAIKNLTGASSLQTLSSGSVTSDFNVTDFTTAMSQDFAIAKTDLNIQWSISDWGGLGAADQALVSLTRSSSDTRMATLSAGSVSQDATITLQAVLGSTTLTKQVTVKALSMEGLKASLGNEITAANGLMSAVTDNNPYITGAKRTLSGYVNSAQSVVDNATATIEEATTALSNIQTAETAFTSAISPYNNFVTYIGTVKAAYDVEIRTASFFTAIKATLNSVLTDAATARTAIASESDITSAKSALLAALTQFNADIPAYSNLETQISSVTSRLTAVNPRKGDSQFLMFPTVTVDAMTTAKTTAEGILASATTATQLTSAQTDLANALTTFNAAPRVAPSATQYYKIYTYGVDNGDGGTTKLILSADDLTTGNDTIKYSAIDHASAINTEWKITEVSTGKYTFQNKAIGTYLNGTTLSETPTEFTLPEGDSQSNLINASGDTYFIYYIVNPSGKGLEVNQFYSTTSTGNFLTNSAPANRFRFCYQFEPVVSVPTDVKDAITPSIRVYVANNNAVIDGIKASESFLVISTTGTVVKSGVASSVKIEIALPTTGVYIVKAGNHTFKIVK